TTCPSMTHWRRPSIRSTWRISSLYFAGARLVHRSSTSVRWESASRTASASGASEAVLGASEVMVIEHSSYGTETLGGSRHVLMLSDRSTVVFARGPVGGPGRIEAREGEKLCLGREGLRTLQPGSVAGRPVRPGSGSQHARASWVSGSQRGNLCRGHRKALLIGCGVCGIH